MEVSNPKDSISRRAATYLLQNADQIFIAYSNRDLASARDIRRRILSLRAGKSTDSVFLASESLPAGEPVSPQVIENVLTASDLLVVLCGATTYQSPWVTREVELALAHQSNAPEDYEILPIILNHGVRLPTGLDFAVQGIHVEHLFPRLFWRRVARIAATTLIILLAVLAIYLEYDRRQEGARSDIRGWLRLDSLQAASPIDLARSYQLEQLLHSAERYGLNDLARRLNELQRQVIDPTLHREVLPAESSRRLLETAVFDSTIWIGYPSRLEGVRINGSLNRSINLASDSIRTPWEEDDPPEISGGPRRPSRLVTLRYEPRVGRVLAEVEFNGSSREPEWAPLERDEDGAWIHPDGDRLDGNEREVLLLEPYGTLESLGLTQRLRWRIGSNLEGEEGGPSWYEVEERETMLSLTNLLDEAECEGLRRWSGDGLYWGASRPPCEDPAVSTERLALDPITGHSLIEVTYPPDPGGSQHRMATALSHLVLWFRVGAPALRVTTVDTYNPEASYLYIQDAGASYEDVDEVATIETQPAIQGTPHATELSPTLRRCPIGALSVRHNLAFACNELIAIDGTFRRELSLHQPVEVVWFTSDGHFLVALLEDGSADVVSVASGEVIHRCAPPPGARDLTVTPDGQEFWVLTANGAVISWPVSAFGPDGLAQVPSPLVNRVAKRAG